MNITQCRMARAALDWTLDDVARESGISRRTIAKFEAGQSVLPEPVEKLRAIMAGQAVAFENGGKRFGVSCLRRE